MNTTAPTRTRLQDSWGAHVLLTPPRAHLQRGSQPHIIGNATPKGDLNEDRRLRTKAEVPV